MFLENNKNILTGTSTNACSRLVFMGVFASKKCLVRRAFCVYFFCRLFLLSPSIFPCFGEQIWHNPFG